MKQGASIVRESVNAQQRRMIEGARAYAESDRSDPFAFDRAMCHTANGIASLGTKGDDACYKADRYEEGMSLPNGTEYKVTRYKNVQRP